MLSDEGLREKYDKDGLDGLGEQPQMDPNLFYSMFFGSEEFEPLIGKMKIHAMMSGGEEGEVPAGIPQEVRRMHCLCAP